MLRALQILTCTATKKEEELLAECPFHQAIPLTGDMILVAPLRVLGLGANGWPVAWRPCSSRLGSVAKAALICPRSRTMSCKHQLLRYVYCEILGDALPLQARLVCSKLSLQPVCFKSTQAQSIGKLVQLWLSCALVSRTQRLARRAHELWSGREAAGRQGPKRLGT